MRGEDKSHDVIDLSSRLTMLESKNFSSCTTRLACRLMRRRSTPRSILVDVGYFSIHLNNEITCQTAQDVYQTECIASSDSTSSERKRVTIINLHSSEFPREREREKVAKLDQSSFSSLPAENGDHPLAVRVYMSIPPVRDFFSSIAATSAVLGWRHI